MIAEYAHVRDTRTWWHSWWIINLLDRCIRIYFNGGLAHFREVWNHFYQLWEIKSTKCSFEQIFRELNSKCIINALNHSSSLLISYSATKKLRGREFPFLFVIRNFYFQFYALYLLVAEAVFSTLITIIRQQLKELRMIMIYE